MASTVNSTQTDGNKLNELLLLHDPEYEVKNQTSLVSEGKRSKNTLLGVSSMDYSSNIPHEYSKIRLDYSNVSWGGSLTTHIKGPMIISPYDINLSINVPAFSEVDFTKRYYPGVAMDFIDHYIITLNSKEHHNIYSSGEIDLFYNFVNPDQRNIYTEMCGIGKDDASRVTLTESEQFFKYPVFCGASPLIKKDLESKGGLHENTDHMIILRENDSLQFKFYFKRRDDMYEITAGIPGNEVNKPTIGNLQFQYEEIHSLDMFHREIQMLDTTKITKWATVSTYRSDLLANSTSFSVPLNYFKRNSFGLTLSFRDQDNEMTDNYTVINLSNSLTKIELLYGNQEIRKFENGAFIDFLDEKLKVLAYDTPQTSTLFIPFTRRFHQCFNSLVSGFLNLSKDDNFRIRFVLSQALGTNFYVYVNSFEHQFHIKKKTDKYVQLID